MKDIIKKVKEQLSRELQLYNNHFRYTVEQTIKIKNLTKSLLNLISCLNEEDSKI